MIDPVDQALADQIARELSYEIDNEVEMDTELFFRLGPGDFVEVIHTRRVVSVVDRSYVYETNNQGKRVVTGKLYIAHDILTGVVGHYTDAELSRHLTEMEVVARSAR